MTILRLPTRRDEERSTLPADRWRETGGTPKPQPGLSFALAVGLSATALGILASIAVPGRGFLVVWALVTLTTSVVAGWEADRVRSAARRVLVNLSRTR